MTEPVAPTGSSMVPRSMVATPWGDSDKLRERQLSPGPGTAADAVAENQRRRIYGAMVASVARRGYDATRVSDLSEISGVSSRSFYKLFPGGKEECFLTVLEQMVDATVTTLSHADQEGEDWSRRLSGIYGRFARMVAAQPATASLLLTEAYAAGPEAAAVLDRAVAAFERLSRRLLKESPEQKALPAAMVQAQVGALQELARTRLRRGEAEALLPLVPELVDLIAGYRPPPGPLRLSTRKPAFEAESPVASDDAERAIRGFILAVAEHGYQGATIHEIARLGSMSPSTFYANFRDKREALLAAIDSSMAQMQALALVAFRRSPGWAVGVRAVIGSTFAFLASRPATANLLLVEVYAGGPEALRVRARGIEDLVRAIGKTGVETSGVPQIAPEVIVGGIAALARRQLLRKGAASLPSLAPIATYIALSPYIGPADARDAANGDGRPGPVTSEGTRLPYMASRQTKWVLNSMLGNRWATAEELAEETGDTVAGVTEKLEELEADGLAERIVPLDDTKPEEWTNTKTFRLLDGDNYAALTPEERRRFLADVTQVLIAELSETIAKGSLGRRLDDHHTRLIVELDEKGWADLAEIHRAAFNASQTVKTESERRVRETGDGVIVGRSVQLLYEVPPEG